MFLNTKLMHQQRKQKKNLILNQSFLSYTPNTLILQLQDNSHSNLQLKSKLQTKEVGEYNSPGPGSYDIQIPIVKPNYKVFKKANESIIIKINRDGGGTSSFKDQQDRWNDFNNQLPGPADYRQPQITQINCKHAPGFQQRGNYKLIRNLLKSGNQKLEQIPMLPIESSSKEIYFKSTNRKKQQIEENQNGLKGSQQYLPRIRQKLSPFRYLKNRKKQSEKNKFAQNINASDLKPFKNACEKQVNKIRLPKLSKSTEYSQTLALFNQPEQVTCSIQQNQQKRNRRMIPLLFQSLIEQYSSV